MIFPKQDRQQQQTDRSESGRRTQASRRAMIHSWFIIDSRSIRSTRNLSMFVLLPYMPRLIIQSDQWHMWCAPRSETSEIDYHDLHI